MRAFCKTCRLASRSYCHVNYHIVTKSRNFFLFNLVVTSCAILTCGETCGLTSGRYCFFSNDIVTESYALCLTYGANCGSLASCACPSVIFLNCCRLSLSCLIPSHVIIVTIAERLDICALISAICAFTAEDHAVDAHGNFDSINIVTFCALSNRICKSYAWPSCIIVFAIPVEEVYCGPCPVVFEVNGNSVFKVKLLTYRADTIYIHVITKLRVFRINKTALAVLTLQACCRLCIFTGVRNRNCNVNSGAVEGDNNDATIFSYCIRLISITSAGIFSTPSVVTYNLKLIRACCNVLIYLGPNTVSISHIVSCVSGIPFCTEMSACTCYCEGSRLSTYCAKVMSIETGMTGSKCNYLFAIKTYLIFCTGCRGSTIFVRTFGNGKLNCNCNVSTLKGNNNCTTSYVNLVSLICAGIFSTPSVVTYNLEEIRACCNVLIYLSIYAVSEGHIVSCVAGIPLCTEMSACTCYCEGSLCAASCAKMRGIVGMSKSGNYGIAAIKTYLICSTGCRGAEICVGTGRTECAPGSATLIPCAFLNAIMVGTISRNSKICCLVPFVVPVISGSAGVHSTEDYAGVFLICRNCNLIHSQARVIGHTNPCLAVSEEVSSETCIRLLPIRAGGEIKFFGLTGGSACCNHRHAHHEYDNCKKSY